MHNQNMVKCFVRTHFLSIHTSCNLASSKNWPFKKLINIFNWIEVKAKSNWSSPPAFAKIARYPGFMLTMVSFSEPFDFEGKKLKCLHFFCVTKKFNTNSKNCCTVLFEKQHTWLCLLYTLQPLVNKLEVYTKALFQYYSTSLHIYNYYLGKYIYSWTWELLKAKTSGRLLIFYF